MSHAADALGYARDVAAGKILACKWVRLAAERHLRDLERQGTEGFPYRFDEGKAERACAFLELLPHTKGRWAQSQPGRKDANRIRLERWQKFIQCCVFGWVHVETGLRRFRIAYVCIPRKNGKSIIAAGDGLYLFAADGEYGAEVYSGATSEKQAWEVFRPAKLMAERTPELCEAFGIGVNAKNLHIHANGSRFEPVIGKPGDGSSPSCAIIDEFHEHQTAELYDTMLTGMGAREQPLVLIITTAGADTAGPCYQLQRDVQNVLEGTTDDEELFGIVYGIDEGDDWTSEEAIRKANPNLGVSVDLEFLRARQREAVRSSEKQNVFKTKHLNVWVTARGAWMNMEAWNGCADPGLSADQFRGESAWVAADVASKVDITSAVRVFRRDGADGLTHYYAFARHYLPEERAEAPEAQHYQKWVHDGRLIATDGGMIDTRVIEADIVSDAAMHRIEQVAYDPWNASDLAVRLQEDHNLTAVEVPQRAAHLSEPMKWLEALVLNGRFHHDGDPVLAWAMSNVTVKVDANENIFPRKDAPQNKIDPAVALIMALSRAMVGDGPKKESAYETRGIRVF